ncbi:hypothetical protein RFI_36990, partial [Reticulomyxa filosa]
MTNKKDSRYYIYNFSYLKKKMKKMFESNESPHAPTLEKVNDEKHHEEAALELAKNQDFQKSNFKLISLIINAVYSNEIFDRELKPNKINALSKVRQVSPKNTDVLNKEKCKIEIMPDPDEKINSGIRMTKENVIIYSRSGKKKLSERVVMKSNVYDKQHLCENINASGTVRVRNDCAGDNSYNKKRSNGNDNCANCKKKTKLSQFTVDLLSTMKK